MADYEAHQSDGGGTIVWTYTVVDSAGVAVNLTGASVTFSMRARSQNAPTINKATATVVSAVAGTVSYTPTVADTAIAGLYSAYWIVTFGSGAVVRYPLDGYMTVEIQENLETVNQALVELDDVKDYLNIPATDRAHDGELLRFLVAITPVIEYLTGPILPRVILNEMYDGGLNFISTRKRPIISVQEVVEFRGPIVWNLVQVASGDLGTIYSYQFEPSGRITRRNIGGGTQTFPPGVDTVRVSYTAGFLVTPPNVREALLETARVNYQTTQQAGGGRIGGAFTPADENIGMLPMRANMLPPRALELLSPNIRHPSSA